jgi:uncharacterized protein with HEPN domain
MDEKILKYCFDIITSIDEIDSFFKESERNFLFFSSNIMLKRAIERNLEIIGGAINRISKIDQDILKNVSQFRSIIGLRNHVIHSYDNVSNEMLWSVVINHLPTLKIEIMEVIDSSEKA